MSVARAWSVEDFRVAARDRLPRVLFDYIDGGSYSEVTLRRNVTDLERIVLRQRVMRDMSAVRTSTELFGQALAMPVVLSPVGFAGMYARRGEVQAARAAATAGVPFALSTLGLCGIEEVTARADVPPWFQLYMTRDRGLMRALIARVREAGAPVLLLTVDLPTPGARYRDLRSGMSAKQSWRGRLRQAIDGATHPGWLWDVWVRGRPHSFDSLKTALPSAHSFADAWAWIGANFDPSVTWADIDFLRAEWDGPIVIKGVLDVEDARAAASAGASGLVVSNHGGRQLDGAMSSVRALPAIADAVGDRLTVLMDGGVRSGLDVLKGLALGARGCLIGRAWAYALAAGGEAGVSKLLATFAAELKTAMVLTGCTDVRAADFSLLHSQTGIE